MSRPLDPTPSQFQKLPQWAQRHIALLEMRLRDAKKELHQHLGFNPSSEFSVFRPGAVTGDGNGPTESFLHPGRTVMCYLDDNKDASYHDRKVVMLRREGDKSTGFHLMVSTWAGYPYVTPQASNCLRIRIGERA